MNRAELLDRLDDPRPWDILVIGGGATGLGTAVDAASRGYRTLLLEKGDFASGTSSRSTKLIHGGVRYLRQGALGLVREALRERELLMRNAPHLVRPVGFVIPAYRRWEKPLYAAGLRLYDLLAGCAGFGPSRTLSRNETLALAPTLNADKLYGGVYYLDCQFDDARLAISLARTLLNRGGVPINHMAVTGLLKSGGRVAGVTALEGENGREYCLPARAVVNAAGVFGDAVRRLDDAGSEPLLAPSQGTHLVLDRAFLPGETAILIPRTRDGRVLFAIPWCGRILLGTTDTPVTTISAEPRALPEEIDYLLDHTARYLNRPPERKDVLSVFAGLRPLVGPPQRRSAALSREHAVVVSDSGLVSVLGGKWTTYRLMGKQAVDQAVAVGGLKPAASVTAGLPLHGWRERPAPDPWLAYGADAEELMVLAALQPGGNELLHPRLPYPECVVTWAVRQEFARTVADVLARRTRALFLDAAASMAMAPRVAQLMAAELRRDTGWERQQVADFRAVAHGYLPE